MYKLVLEESLKDDSCVILCGKHAYANMVKHGVPVEKPTMNRRWFITVQRKLSPRRLYICMHHKRAVTVPERYRKQNSPAMRKQKRQLPHYWIPVTFRTCGQWKRWNPDMKSSYFTMLMCTQPHVICLQGSAISFIVIFADCARGWKVQRGQYPQHGQQAHLPFSMNILAQNM